MTTIAIAGDTGKTGGRLAERLGARFGRWLAGEAKHALRG